MLKILQKEDPVLRKTAKEVALGDINTPEINKILAEMAETLDSCEDGVALAAPQIGKSIRVFIVSPKAFLTDQEDTDKENDKEKGSEKKEQRKLVYINPSINRKSSKKVVLEEGCLSVRHVFGKIKRHEKVTIQAYDEHGQKFTRGAAGLLSEIFQHETDHLNGTLFIDSATDLVKIADKPTEHAK